MISLLSLLLWQGTVRAAIDISADAEKLSLAGRVEVMADPSGELTFTEAIAETSASQYAPLPGYLNLGYTEAASWLRFSLRNTEAIALTRILRLAPSYLDHVDVYFQAGDNPDDAAHYQKYALGDHTPAHAKPMNSPRMAAPLQLEPGRSHRVYIRIQTHSAHSLSLELLATDAYTASENRNIAWQSAYFAIAASLALINLLLAMRLRSRVNAMYGVYLLTLTTLSIGIEGLAGLLLPQLAHRINDVLAGIGTGLGIAAMCAFCCLLFDTRRYHLSAHRYLMAIAALGVVTCLASGTAWYGRFAVLLVANAPVLTALMPWLAWNMIRRGEIATGRLVFLAFFASFIGATIASLRVLGLLPAGDIGANSIQVTSVVHMILMMLGLSERVLDAEAKALTAARESEHTAIRLAEKMTEEIRDGKRQLEKLLGNERRMREEQTRFIDTISHEYRTPLSIVRTNLDILEAKQQIPPERFTVMTNALARLQDIFTEALQAHRLGRPPSPNIEDLDFAALVQAAIDELRHQHPGCPLRLDLPARSAPVAADANLLMTALRNVLQNADKYRFPADAQHPVVVTLWDEAKFFRLSVSNPVDPSLPIEHDRLFERYVRGATGRGRSGMGLGLYLARRILNDHGGKVVIGQTAPDRFEIIMRVPRHDA